MAQFWSKLQLYMEIDRLRRYYSLPKAPINAFALVRGCCHNPSICFADFEEPKICGMLYQGKKTTSIILNNCHSKKQQNFYCAHEFIHYSLHPKDEQTFVCHNFEATVNDYLEWQANEGAAELLMPYEVFIPDIVDKLSKYEEFPDTYERYLLIDELSKKYRVSPASIECRIQTLMFEMMQFATFRSMKDVVVMARTSQLQQNVVQYRLSDVYSKSRPRTYTTIYFPSLDKSVKLYSYCK